jgi:hypothetical protein
MALVPEKFWVILKHTRKNKAKNFDALRFGRLQNNLVGLNFIYSVFPFFVFSLCGTLTSNNV